MHDTPSDQRSVMHDVNFRWLLSGSVISMLGDQLTVLALPWLVLKMTGSAFATGMIIATTGAPRAIFILIGGALVDRYTPKRVLLLTKYVNATLLGLLALMVLSGHVVLDIVFALALGIGLASAFSIPSGTAVLPHVLPTQNLQMANTLMMGTRQVTLLAGPLLAGLLIALAGEDATLPVADARGLGLAFGFDCLSFVVSAWTLARVRVRHMPEPQREQAVLSAVRAGLATVWHDRDMRTCFCYWAVVMFCIGGSMQVALPVLAHTRLHGAGSLGQLMGAHGAGSLIGMVATAVVGKRRAGSLGNTLLLLDAVAGAFLIPLGFITAAWQGVVLLLVVGALGGFMQVAVFTWLQRRVQPVMLGRAMSIFMFIFMGLAPLSALSTGWLMQYVSLTQLFAGSGCFLLGVAALTFIFTPMRHVADPPPGAPNQSTSFH
ncbi:MFS transporter [Caballeronia sp. SEWSISQ10-4 2]|uniref:MFS transporter n=1 Tax=Caballeronia sp. SEWSISQ10-4 2 TaxID=2937438 RepID=UPI00264B1C2E|nr:MFS transporter [Caballeronia sp. SEWSISQ10-4 2]MDN7183631.1 MFS transporter [Caballeronia sp. SEWSISQ10-4 2]